MKTEIVVRAVWDDSADVWVATSDDVPGLVIEAPSTDLLEAELKAIIPQLLIENRSHHTGGIDIPVQLLQQSRFTAHVA